MSGPRITPGRGLKGDTGGKGDPGLDGTNGTDGVNGTNGTDGTNGIDGIDGTDGRTILYGTTPPGNGLGADGDGYVDVTAGVLYAPKAAGAWPAGRSLIGQTGEKGEPGETGPAGAAMLTGTGPPSNALGVDGQHYLDQIDHVTYGPKSGGVWPVGVSLVGPQGPAGAGSPPATTAAQGAVKISVAPATVGDPIAAGDNDPRLSDARTPTAHASSHAAGGPDPLSPAQIGAAAATHTHAQADVTGLAVALAGKADLVGGLVPTSQIPAIALTVPFPVANRAAMLALDAQPGDFAVVAADNDGKRHVYALQYAPATTFGNWLLMDGPDAPVSTVNGQVGTVVLGAADVGAAASNDPRLTNARTPTAHTSSHAAGGTDAIAPADIGAIATSARGAAGGVAGLDSDSRIAATAVPLLSSRTETTSITAAVADHGTVIEFNSATAVTYTIPTGLPKGWWVEIYQLGAGQVTVAAGSGISTPEERQDKFKTAGQKASITARMRTTTNVVVSGDVA